MFKGGSQCSCKLTFIFILDLIFFLCFRHGSVNNKFEIKENEFKSRTNWPTAYTTGLGLSVIIEVGIFSTHNYLRSSTNSPNNFILILFPSPQNKKYGLVHYIYYKYSKFQLPLTYLLHFYENSVLSALWPEEAVKNNEKKNSTDDQCTVRSVLSGQPLGMAHWLFDTGWPFNTSLTNMRVIQENEGSQRVKYLSHDKLTSSCSYPFLGPKEKSLRPLDAIYSATCCTSTVLLLK